MLNIQSYGSSSGEDSDSSDTKAHLKPISSEFSVAKSIQIESAPLVVPVERQLLERAIKPTEKELMYNPKYEELFTPVRGPENPFLTEQQKAPKNTASGFIEKAHVSDFQFENQRRTFHSYGYALDPSADSQNNGDTFVGPNLEAAYNTEGKTVFESAKLKASRKRHKNDNPEDLEGFLGPWGKYQDEMLTAQPSEQEKAEIEEMMAKKQRRNKREVEEKPVEEKSILHISDSVDYQGRSFLHPPHDVGVSLKAGSHPDRCFLPKAHIHTWTGHTKGISTIKLFPKSSHLLLSCSMDTKIKIWEVYNERRCVRTYSGHRQAVRDIDFNARGTQFVSAGYDRYLKLWDTETGSVVSRFTSRKIPYCVKFHPDYNKQHLFVCGTSDKKILCVSRKFNAIRLKIIIPLNFSGTREAVKLYKNTIVIWEL
jgi:pre-mRNA-processing factor 17